MGRIVIRLDELLHARRMTLTELATRIDITLANLSILKTGKAKAIRFSTLEAICRELDCQPGDILEYMPGDGVEEIERGGVFPADALQRLHHTLFHGL